MKKKQLEKLKGAKGETATDKHMSQKKQGKRLKGKICNKGIDLRAVCSKEEEEKEEEMKKAAVM